MKKLLIAILCFWAVLNASVGAVQNGQSTSKDLYYSYQSSKPNQGRPGARVRVELRRNGETRNVPTTAEFRTGDLVAFRVKINFPGHVTVDNFGSTGNLTRLFSHRVTPSDDFRIPQEGWVRFDANKGEEIVIFTLSRNPIPQLESAPTQSQSNGGQVTGSQAQEILDELNSRALSNGERDLEVVAAEDETYALSSSIQTFEKPTAFKIKLKHK